MTSRLPSALGLRSTLGGQLLALLFSASRRRPASPSARGLRLLAVALLLGLTALPAQAQRGRTAGSRESAPTEERRAPSGEQKVDSSRRAPAERAQPSRRTEETRRAEPARPSPNRMPARPEETRRTEPSNGRATTTTRPGSSRGTDDASERRSGEAGSARGRTAGSSRTPAVETPRASQPPRVVTVPGTRDERRWDPNVTVQRDRYDDRYRDDRYRDDRYRNDRRSRRPGIDIDLLWPWEQRYRSGWSPRYRYRQVVYAESGYRRDRYETRYEVRTLYRQRVLSATSSRAHVELLLDELEVYQNNRFVGRITRLPSGFERIRATLSRNGRVDFEKELYVVGDAREGFELVSTRGYDGYAFARWRRGDELRAAYLDFRRQRAEPVRDSRFFDPYGYQGFAPIAILPDDADWLGDFGPYSASAYPYYGGGYDRGYDGDRYGADDRYYYGGVRVRPYEAPRGATSGSGEALDDRGYDAPRGSVSGSDPALPTLRRDSDRTYTTQGGATVRLRREAEIERVE